MRILLLVSFLALFCGSACAQNDETPTMTMDGSEARSSESTATLDDLRAHPERYEGRRLIFSPAWFDPVVYRVGITQCVQPRTSPDAEASAPGEGDLLFSAPGEEAATIMDMSKRAGSSGIKMRVTVQKVRRGSETVWLAFVDGLFAPDSEP